jgi:serine/threonine-protein kinase ATR
MIIRDYNCVVCEESQRTLPDGTSESRRQEVSVEAIATFQAIFNSPSFQQSRRCRVIAMFALRRFALHFSNAELIDLETSRLGQWCLTSLRSSIRELRVAAG